MEYHFYSLMSCALEIVKYTLKILHNKIYSCGYIFPK